MKQYSTPILETVILSVNEDIITASGGLLTLTVDEENPYSGFGDSNATQGVWNW